MLRNLLPRETYQKYTVFRIGPVQKILVLMICIHWLCKYDEKKVDSVYIVVTHFVSQKHKFSKNTTLRINMTSYESFDC